ncbi:MAG TPA: carnitine dehydratase [Deltaproteobacteria bacterium]|nr:carnitine dehydratase [Deltaproteobacteria bacterium]
MSCPPRPLSGIRVLELGQLVAGPFAGSLLASFGAEVIKVEAPDGDPIRQWRTMVDGTSVWWRTLARNKRLVSLDLRSAAGRAAVRRIIPKMDVVIENFRPGRMEQWNLSPAELEALAPGVIVCRVSGYGQTGPDRDLPGYASVAEARGGLRYLTGVQGGPTVRSNLSLGDSIAGLHAALGVVVALLHRLRGGDGQVVDVSLLEAMVSMMEGAVTEASVGVHREPSGSTITGVAPSGSFPCLDGEVVLGANGETLFGRLCTAMGRPDLASDPRFCGNEARVANREALRSSIATWTSAQTVAEVVRKLAEARVPAGPIQSPAQLLTDPQLQAREALWEVWVQGKRMVLPPVGPRLATVPPRRDHPGRAHGADTRAVLMELAGMSEAEVEQLLAAPAESR